MTDYKFWYIERDDDGFITEAAVRFYEGNYVDGIYKRTTRLQDKDLKHLNKLMKKEDNGNEAIIYTSLDFGTIKTDDELRQFLNNELAKDTTRVAIPEQRRA